MAQDRVLNFCCFTSLLFSWWETDTGTVRIVVCIIIFQAVWSLPSWILWNYTRHFSQWTKITLIFKRILGGRRLEKEGFDVTSGIPDNSRQTPSRLIIKCLCSVCFLSVYITLSLPCKGPFAALIFVLLCSLKHFSILQKRRKKKKRKNMGNCYAIETDDCNLRKKKKPSVYR